jgi:hypothetical protein
MSWKNPDTFDELTTSGQFDIREMIARFEELESELERRFTDEHPDEDSDTEGAAFTTWLERQAEDDTVSEFRKIRAFLEDVRGNGGDEQWRGDWYPVGFIADHYFEDYARELAEDIGAVQSDASWPNTHIDWRAAADALRQDYSSVDIDGSEYWYR